MYSEATAWDVPEVVSPASGLPVSLDDARWEPQVGEELDDDRVSKLVHSAADWLARKWDVSILETTLRVWIDYRREWLCAFYRHDGYREIPLPRWPAKEISSVKVWDTEGTEATISSDLYDLLSPRPSERPILWISDEAVPDSPRAIRFMAIEWVAGWEDADALPGSRRIGLLKAIQYLHEESGLPRSERLGRWIANNRPGL